MKKRFGLEEATFEKIHSVFAKYPQVERVIIYGSRAKGDYRRGSDIDLTLLGGEELTQQVVNQIIDQIDDLLLPYMFDISLFKNISDTDVIEHIQRVGVTFFEKGVVTPEPV